MAESSGLSSGLEIFVPFIGVKLMDESKHPLKDIPQEAISGLEVEEALEEPGLFRIYLNDTVDIKTQKRSWGEDKNLQPENTVKISIGYVPDPASKLLSFIGRIRSIGTQGEDMSETLEIRGYDLSYDLKKTDSAGIVYNDKKYSDIITEIAGNNKLKTDKIETSKLTYENIIRPPGESDYTFLKKVAEEIGFEAFVQEESLYFRKPKDTVKGKLSFEPGKEILNFYPTMSTAVVVSELTVNSWDIKKKKMISGKATLSDIKSGVGTKEFSSAGNKLKKIKINLGNRVLRSAEEAKNVAISELKRRNKGFIKAELECIGTPALRPGITINLENVEPRFNGVYYIERAIHTVGKNGYKTNLSLRGCL